VAIPERAEEGVEDVTTSRTRRREFLARTVSLAGTALLALPRLAAAEPPPEIRKIRFNYFPAICLAPQYFAEEFLRLEGFSEVEYPKGVQVNKPDPAPVETDLWMDAAPGVVGAIDRGVPITALGGIHAGCYELFASDRVRAIRDLKGKTVAIGAEGGLDHVLISSMVAYVGVDPKKDIHWSIAGTNETALQQFIGGKADAYLGFAPQPQELRAKKIGHAILSTTQDRPWSQYFCCMLVARKEFMQRYPIATKRALRAVLRAADVCAEDPERAARFMATKGYEPRYELGLEVLKGLPYRRWREANPEDTLRFYSLRMREAGLIKSTPQKIIAQGTDCRFLNELKKELKA
jgi:NitT/TauT family transport system substrate-binding protein